MSCRAIFGCAPRLVAVRFAPDAQVRSLDGGAELAGGGLAERRPAT